MDQNVKANEFRELRNLASRVHDNVIDNDLNIAYEIFRDVLDDYPQLQDFVELESESSLQGLGSDLLSDMLGMLSVSRNPHIFQQTKERLNATLKRCNVPPEAYNEIPKTLIRLGGHSEVTATLVKSVRDIFHELYIHRIRLDWPIIR